MSQLAFADLLLRDTGALVVVKATVVLALASGAAMAARGFSAARRHMLWLVALSSCVWLVLSSPVVPAIMIHTPLLAQKVVGTAAPTATAVPNVRNALIANAPRVRERFPSTQAVRRSTLQSIPLPSHPFITLWVIGCVALIVRHAAGFVGTTRLARRASVATDDETTREVASVTAAVGVRREVRLSYSAEVETPITFGIAKPYMLLPTEARSWSIERRRAVLVHETAHISRGDYLSQTIGRVACALFWFHPLVWRAFAHLRDEAERAADDCVLRSGIPACEYAKHLLELARRTTDGRTGIVAVGIVSTNDLERRFVAMFDIERSRTTVTTRARAVTASFALAIVCPFASLRVAGPAQQMNAPLPHAALPHAPLPYVSTPQPATATRAAAGEHDPARVPRTLEVPAAIVAQPAPETTQASVAVVDRPAPSPVVHPDFSGKWTQDTVAGPTVDFLVTDSTIIAQSEKAISFESRGRAPEGPTHNRFQTVTFDGAQSTGFAATSGTATNFVASAIWVADTLLLKTYAMVGAHDFLTYERMTLSPDGKTLFVTNSSFVDAKYRWGGPLTFVLRRITP